MAKYNAIEYNRMRGFVPKDNYSNLKPKNNNYFYSKDKYCKSGYNRYGSSTSTIKFTSDGYTLRNWRYSCLTNEPAHPVRMNKLHGYKVCGQRGGTPFVNATRPISVSGNILKCPDGYLPCDDKGDLDKTICRANTTAASAVCPITSIGFNNSDISKITTRKDGKNLPVITTKLDS